MKTNFKIRTIWSVLFILIVFTSCQNDDKDLQTATYSTNPEVFIDGFTPGLIYAAFSNTDIFAFQVDTQVTYNNSSAAMRFDVPNVNDPAGTYAGGSFFLSVGRDLSSYDCLTFWAKSTTSATIDVLGFGNDLGENKFQTSLNNVAISTTWRKYIIPIPDPSKLKIEKGMFYYAEGPENGQGYSFWIDDLKFEKLGTIGYPSSTILNGLTKTETAFIGVTKQIDGLTAILNMPNAINQSVGITASYFDFKSSNPAVATVDTQGKITVNNAGTTTITAKLGGVNSVGSLTINCLGAYLNAPTPTLAASNVISIFSDKYANIPVNYTNGYWAPYQTTTSSDFAVNGDNVLNYGNFNFVGIEFSSPTINATAMTHLHLDVFIPNTIASNASLKIKIADFGADGTYGGTGANADVTSNPVGYNSSAFTAGTWKSLDIPLTSFTGLPNRLHLAQLVLDSTVSNLSSISNIYVDNIYFHN